MEVSGASVSFGGSFEVTGTTLVSAGTAAFEGAAATTNLTQSSGVVRGEGTLLVNGMFAWSAGTQTDAGTTRIEAGATLVLSTTLSKSFSGGRT